MMVMYSHNNQKSVYVLRMKYEYPGVLREARTVRNIMLEVILQSRMTEHCTKPSQANLLLCTRTIHTTEVKSIIQDILQYNHVYNTIMNTNEEPMTVNKLQPQFYMPLCLGHMFMNDHMFTTDCMPNPTRYASHSW